MCDPILGALIKMQPIILHLVVKIDSIQQHIPISPLLGSIPPPGGGAPQSHFNNRRNRRHRILNLVRPKEENPNIFHTDVLQNIKFNGFMDCRKDFLPCMWKEDRLLECNRLAEKIA